MAQNAYPAHLYQQQPTYPQYAPSNQPNPAGQYQPQSYPQPNVYQQHPPPIDTQQRYPSGPSPQAYYPPLQTQFLPRVAQGPPTPYSPSQPHPSQPGVHYHQPQPVVAPTPADITQRPLPNPANAPRPGSVAQAEGASSGFNSQSRQISHRPSSSLSTSPSSASQVASAISKFSSMSVNTASMSQNSSHLGRPLPQPRATQTVRSGSPVKLPQPAQPSGVPVTPSSSQSQPHEQPDLPGQKFVPMWRRTLPSPMAPSPGIANNPQTSTMQRTPVIVPALNGSSDPKQNSQPAMARRPTISRPLPQSPGGQSTPSRMSLPNAPSSHGQLPRPPQTPGSTPRTKPIVSGSIPSDADAQVIPSHSPFQRRERSRTLPQPQPPPTSAIPSRPVMTPKKSEPVARTTRIASSVSTSSDEDLSGISLLQRRSIHKDSNGVDPTPTAPRTPSPQYGIKDLPSRSRVSNETTPRGQQVNSSRHVRAPSSPTRAPPLPNRRTPSPTRTVLSSGRFSPPKAISNSPERVPSVIHQPSDPQSSIFKFATMEALGYVPATSPPTKKAEHPMQEMTRTASQHSRWPEGVPRLPKPPGQSSSGSSPGSSVHNTSPVRTSQVQPKLPIRDQSLNNPVANTPFSQRQNHSRFPPNLDDAPPPSLRRSPSPDPTRRAPHTGLPSIRTQDSRGSPVRSHPPSAVTPNSAASMFSLSEFPAVPSHPPPPPPALPSQPRPKEGGPRSPQRPSPRRYDSDRPSIPKISFPADPDDDSSDSDVGGPVINISGPGGSTTGPIISIGNFDEDEEDDGQFPGISINVADDSEQQPHRPRAQRELPPPAAVLGQGGRFCGGCGGTIMGRIVSAMGERWHPDCFKCCVCDERLENLSSYEHEGRPYCHLDYHEIFAPRCYHCQTAIVDELFITLDDHELGKRTYHEQHFFCAECGDPFVPPGSGNRSFSGDGLFKADEDDVGFTVFRGHPYCEACHVKLRLPKCKKCKKSIRDGTQAVEAMGWKWCWECFTCMGCDRPFDNLSFYERDQKPFCERCFSIIIKSEI
ncbi:unnamed protein product [Somion occarium]|uniref:LIM zinc-binding domain-containing protein n=1 Tax=Somion occarium TaxID=3059160 RepID=A0ABP1CV32_9APHY